MQEMQASIFQQFTVTKRGFRERILKTGSQEKCFVKSAMHSVIDSVNRFP